MILEDLYEVVEYETGGEALAGFAQDKPDLVLLDISLPDLAAPYVARARAFQAARRFALARKDLARARERGGDQVEIDRLLRQLDRIPTALPWETILLLEVPTFSTHRPDWTTATTLVKREIPPGSVALALYAGSWHLRGHTPSRVPTISF